MRSSNLIRAGKGGIGSGEASHYLVSPSRLIIPERRKDVHLVTTEHLRRFAKPEERAVACPICRGRLFAVLLTPEQVLCEKEWLDEFFAERTEEPKEKSDFTQDSPTFVVSCSQCGTVMRDPQPTGPPGDKYASPSQFRVSIC